MKALKWQLSRVESELADTKEEMKNMLVKLQPLLSKDGRRERGVDGDRANLPRVDGDRASLSLLEVFLKKYKINMF